MSTVLEPSQGSKRTDQPTLSLSNYCEDDSYRIVVSGELDLATAPTLDDALHQAHRSNRPTVTIDLDQVSFCDCAGMRVLTTHHHALAEAGRLLLIDHPSLPVSRLAALTGLDQTLDLDPTDPIGPRTTPEQPRPRLDGAAAGSRPNRSAVPLQRPDDRNSRPPVNGVLHVSAEAAAEPARRRE